jgi:hypothetical protein
MVAASNCIGFGNGTRHEIDIKVDVLLGDFDGDFDPSIIKKNNIH